VPPKIKTIVTEITKYSRARNKRKTKQMLRILRQEQAIHFVIYKDSDNKEV
jgi:hypothetical protein